MTATEAEQARTALRDHATTGRLPEGEGRAFITGWLAGHRAAHELADAACTCECRGECRT